MNHIFHMSHVLSLISLTIPPSEVHGVQWNWIKYSSHFDLRALEVLQTKHYVF